MPATVRASPKHVVIDPECLSETSSRHAKAKTPARPRTYLPIFTLIQASGRIFRSIYRQRRHVAQLTCELVDELGETFRQ
jgi:hypothetical protein